MRLKQCAMLGMLLAVFAFSALANVISTATATADCSGYNLTVSLSDLTPNVLYTIDYNFLLTCGGSTTPVSGTIGPFSIASGSTSTQSTGTITWPTTPLTTNCTLTGTATLVGQNTVNITFNGQTSLALTCGGTACPATIGFWKHHAFPNSVQASGLTIGGVNYSASDLLNILNASSGGNAVNILGKQLVGALLNLAAGAKHNASADAAIATANALLQANSLDLRSSFVAASSTLGQAMLVQANILDGYNSADFNTCSENSGLILGT